MAMFYIFHGEDEFTRLEEVTKFRAQVMVQGMGDLNIARLDGRKLSLPELINVWQHGTFPGRSTTDHRRGLSTAFRASQASP